MSTTNPESKPVLPNVFAAGPQRPWQYSERIVNANSLPDRAEEAIILALGKPASDPSNTANAVVCIPLEPGNQVRLRAIVDKVSAIGSLAGDLRVYGASHASKMESAQYEMHAEHLFDVSVDTSADPPVLDTTSIFAQAGNVTGLADALAILNNAMPSPIPVVVEDGRTIIFEQWGYQYLLIAGNVGDFEGIRVGVRQN